MTTYSIAERKPALRNKGISQVFNWLLLARQRRQLATLDDHALEDMGLTQADVARESKRAAWDVPAHWQG
ncbi:uncharacterized protein DUF1127 [Shimia isoporae]|uniref:Uncharacterized protein DUF1127 n=1 Tax=Shimia isoporae TaxID=647720 RepID=A0A4R1N123_9RHOB|nr:DUF1127 domain-containing protein [Shimia isoporae]TCK99404.1 uncharacterized protein DUF1127 [Shimia isoporae]